MLVFFVGLLLGVGGGGAAVYFYAAKALAAFKAAEVASAQVGQAVSQVKKAL